MGNLYDSLTPKQRRVIRHELDLIFSQKGITFPTSVEEMRSLMDAVGFFPQEFRFKDKQVFFSKEGVAAIRNVSTLIEETRLYRDELTYNDIFGAILKEIERWFNQELAPDESDFIQPLEHVLCSKIATRGFFCRVEGVSLDGINEMAIGSKTIKEFDPKDVGELAFTDEELRNVILREYENSTIIEGYQTGSDAAAQERFYYTSELCLSVLRLYACILYQWAILTTHIRLVNICLGSYGNASCVGWAAHDKSVAFTRYFKAGHDLVLNSSQIDHLKAHCLLAKLGSLIDKSGRDELEEAVVRSVYWFGEAEKDRDRAGKWLKLWSCLESFFSSQKKDITESNARGVAVLLVFGRYEFKEFNDYAALKSKVKRFYVVRSKAVHRGEYQHIDDATLCEFSYIVAWIVVVMTSLSESGYTKLAQVKREIDRLDAICTEEGRTRCKVYQSGKSPCVFLIIPSDREFSDLPAGVQADIGTATLWKEIDLYPGRNLTGLDSQEAVKNIESRGYHIQAVEALFKEEA
jgi:uncharacterized protein YcgL (UPF0745 family)